MTTTKQTDVAIKRDVPPPAPTRDLFGSLRQEIDRLFDDFSWPVIGIPRRPRVWSLEPMRDWMPSLSALPAMDLVEADGSYELSVELPGMTRDEIELRLSEGALTVRGEKTEEKKEDKVDYHLQERRYGSVQRSIALPAGIDADKVQARFEDGVLKVSLPKSQDARAKERKIEIKAA